MTTHATSVIFCFMYSVFHSTVSLIDNYWNVNRCKPVQLIAYNDQDCDWWEAEEQDTENSMPCFTLLIHRILQWMPTWTNFLFATKLTGMCMLGLGIPIFLYDAYNLMYQRLFISKADFLVIHFLPTEICAWIFKEYADVHIKSPLQPFNIFLTDVNKSQCGVRYC